MRSIRFIILSLPAIMLLLSACAGESGQVAINTTPVTITIGDGGSAQNTQGVGVATQATTAIPAAVKKMIVEAKFINAAGRLVIIQSATIEITGQRIITLSWNIESGAARYFTAKGFDADGKCLYYGETKINLMPRLATRVPIKTDFAFSMKNFINYADGGFGLYRFQKDDSTAKFVSRFYASGDIVTDYSTISATRVYSSQNNDQAFYWNNDQGLLGLRRYQNVGYLYYTDPSGVKKPRVLLPPTMILQNTIAQGYREASRPAGMERMVQEQNTLVDFEDLELNNLTFIGTARIFQEWTDDLSSDIHRDITWLAPGVGEVKRIEQLFSPADEEAGIPEQLLNQYTWELVYGKTANRNIGTPPAGTVAVITNRPEAVFKLNNGALSGGGVCQVFTDQPAGQYQVDFGFIPQFAPAPRKIAQLRANQGLILASYYRKPVQLTDNDETGIILGSTNPVPWENFIVWKDWWDGGGDGLLEDLTLGDLTGNALNFVPLTGDGASYWDIIQDVFWNHVAFSNYMDVSDLIYTGASMPEVGSVNVMVGPPPSEPGLTPAVFGDYIFWSDYQFSDPTREIYVKEKKSGFAPLYTANDDQYCPEVWYNQLAEVTLTTGDIPQFDLYSVNNQSLDRSLIVPGGPGPFAPPRIFENNIVYAWNTGTPNGFDVFLYDLDSSTNTTIFSGPGDQINPDIYGGVVVWEDQSGADTDVYMMNLVTGELNPLAGGVGNQKNPRVFGERVVWDDDRFGLPNIFYVDLGISHMAPLTYRYDEQSFPAIDGQNVVFELYQGSTNSRDVVLFNLDNGLESPLFYPVVGETCSSPKINGNYLAAIYDGEAGQGLVVYAYDLDTGWNLIFQPDWDLLPGDQQEPALFYPWVAWTDYSNDPLGDVYLYNLELASGEEPIAVVLDATEGSPALSDRYLVWADNRNGNFDIWIFDLITGVEQQLISANQNADQIHPAIWNALVVYEAIDPATEESDIYIYDITTGTETLICGDPGDQVYPKIANNLIVWTGDNSNAAFDRDIYLFDMNTLITTQVTNKEGDQVNCDVSGNAVVYQDNSVLNGNIAYYRYVDGTRAAAPAVQGCIPRAYSDCYGGNVWWFNSCGEAEALKETCMGGCNTGACLGP